MTSTDSSLRIASVDIGSNSVILLVAERDPRGHWRSLLDEALITRVSEGMDATGVLGPAPIERTGAALERFAARCRDLGVARIHATGTAPFRRARNGAEVAHLLGTRLGAPIHIASGEEEAELGLLATRRAFPELHKCMIVDIGGASTELIGMDGAGPAVTHSLDLGAVRLSERFGGADALSPERRAEIVRCVEAALESAGLRSALDPWVGAPLIGIAGTVTTLMAASLGQRAWDADSIHGATLTRSVAGALTDRLCAMNAAERAEVPGIPGGRADVIAAGAVLLTTLMDALQVSELRVSDRGVRWGRLHREEDP